MFLIVSFTNKIEILLKLELNKYFIILFSEIVTILFFISSSLSMYPSSLLNCLNIKLLNVKLFQLLFLNNLSNKYLLKKYLFSIFLRIIIFNKLNVGFKFKFTGL